MDKFAQWQKVRIALPGDEMDGEVAEVRNIYHDKVGTAYEFGRTGLWFDEKELEAA